MYKLYTDYKAACKWPIIGPLICWDKCAKYPGAHADLITGKCFSCPPDMTRTAALVTAKDACAGYGLGVATDPQGEAFCKKKYSGFSDSNGHCYTCPGGMKRTAAAVTTDTACSAAGLGAGALSKGAQEYCKSGNVNGFPDANGYCYNCPKDMERTAALIDSDSACSAAGINPLGALSKDAQEYCKNNNTNAFPDANGYCYNCPKDMERTAAILDSDSACSAAGINPLGALSKEAQEYCKKTNGFPDANGYCYDCPKDMKRTAAVITSSSACSAAGINPEGALSKAAINYCSSQKSGSFPDADGDCYGCPTNMYRTAALIKSSTACSAAGMNPEGALSKAAISYCSNAKSGSFPDANGYCYGCPSDMARTAALIKSDSACSAAGINPEGALSKAAKEYCSNVKPGSFPDPNGGCYACPSDMSRTAASVSSDSACSAAGLNPEGALSSAAKDYCHRYSSHGFPDPDGRCYKCPDDYKRTIFSIHGDKACTKSIFGPYHDADHIGDWVSSTKSYGKWISPVTKVGTWTSPVTKAGSWVGPTTKSNKWIGPATKSNKWTGSATKSNKWTGSATDHGTMTGPAKIYT